LTQEFDVVCFGAGELVLAIKFRSLKALADVIYPFQAFNRVLGATVEELAAKTAMQHVACS
jgi:hypothetical protein